MLARLAHGLSWHLQWQWAYLSPSAQPCRSPVSFTSAPLPTTLQAIELAPGMSSQLFWQEAQLLRHCIHDRIVPLYGVGIQVRWCSEMVPIPEHPEVIPLPACVACGLYALAV